MTSTTWRLERKLDTILASGSEVVVTFTRTTRLPKEMETSMSSGLKNGICLISFALNDSTSKVSAVDSMM